MDMFRGFRRLSLELLEDRHLLSGTTVDLSALRAEWSDFTFADDLNLIVIAAEDLSIASIKSAIANAAETESDDLILIRQSEHQSDLIFTDASDVLLINSDAASKGRITIIADGNAPLRIDAKSLNRVLTVSAGSEVQIGNLSLTGGLGTSDLSGDPAICGTGGGVANAGILRLDQVQITGNQVDSGLFDRFYYGINSSGGGIYNAGSLFVYRSEISNNTALSGSINDNEQAAFGAGGGIFNASNASILLENCTLQNNTADFGLKYLMPQFSGVELAVPVQVEVMGKGGGIYNLGTVILSGESTVSGNSAWSGGGICNGISGIFTILESAVQENYAFEFGGGIYSDLLANLNIHYCFIRGNTAESNGGGIALRGNLDLTGSVISGNIAGENGGGICSYGYYNSSRPVNTVRIVNATITGNLAGTVEAGSGGGISFCGADSGNTIAELTVSNSIIVGNKVHTAKDPDLDLNIAAEGSCIGFHSLSTFQKWTDGEGNLLYNSSVPLFLSDYHFNSKTEGDYHLVQDSASQAIDHGNSGAAQSAGLGPDSTDLSGNSRIRNERIDLGAYEYQPTDFDSAFPSRLSVSPGCSFRLVCEGSDTNGFEYTRYLVDFDGDGIFDLSGSDIWISWNDLNRCAGGKGYFWLAAENTEGETCAAKQVAVVINPYIPSISVKEYTFLDGQILKLAVSINSYDLKIQEWTLYWGGESDPISYKISGSLLIAAHYYGPQSQTTEFSLLLDLKDSEDNVVTYYLGSHTVPGTQAESQTAEFVDNGEELAPESELLESDPSEAPVPERDLLALDLLEKSSSGYIRNDEKSEESKKTPAADTLPVSQSVVPAEQDYALSDPDLLTKEEYDYLIEAHKIQKKETVEKNLLSSGVDSLDEILAVLYEPVH
ncbi:MAG: right-handed parallel beta-helix repeat-containing protein [Planctomycetia bacterium]|nr:right-handed parallel beta-helix repeat-containing protein [Planctomycetia bacterium]